MNDEIMDMGSGYGSSGGSEFNEDLVKEFNEELTEEYNEGISGELNKTRNIATKTQKDDRSEKRRLLMTLCSAAMVVTIATAALPSSVPSAGNSSTGKPSATESI